MDARAKITDQPIDPEALAGEFRARCKDGIGAICSFVGQVRGEGQTGQQVSHLEIEQMPDMAQAKLAEFASIAADRFDIQALEIVHRIGTVHLGEPIVVVLVAAGHRRAASEACSYLVEALKADLPVWKKECGPDGEHWVDAS